MKRLAWLAVLGLVCAGCSGGGINSYEDALQTQMNVMEDMLEVLEGVTDEASAEKATPRVEDLGNKRVIYADLGVREYFIFDPLDGSLASQLRGLRLEGGEYIPMVGMPLHSEVLGLDLVVEEDQLRLYHPHTGERLRVYAEAEAARREAEAENARLREELARLQAQKGE